MSAVADHTEIAARLSRVSQRVADAAARVGRTPASVMVVAVSKGFDAAAITAARDAGQLDFGENRAQELRRKAGEVQGVRWHFVGRLQRNKVPDVVGTAALVHSVDRLDLAEALAGRARRSARVQRVLVQVNAGEDPAKGGCSLSEAPGLVEAVRGLAGLSCEGLMAIPPANVDPRPTFARLRSLRDDLRGDFPEVQHLSMGMTNDFEAAVEEGATIVRIGEAVFGPRPDSDLRRPTGPSPDRPPAMPAGRA